MGRMLCCSLLGERGTSSRKSSCVEITCRGDVTMAQSWGIFSWRKAQLNYPVHWFSECFILHTSWLPYFILHLLSMASEWIRLPPKIPLHICEATLRNWHFLPKIKEIAHHGGWLEELARNRQKNPRCKNSSFHYGKRQEQRKCCILFLYLLTYRLSNSWLSEISQVLMPPFGYHMDEQRNFHQR